MNKQKIVCKAISTDEIKYKETLGVDGVEWQIVEGLNNYKIDYFGLPIYSVHTLLGEASEKATPEVEIDNVSENFSHSKAKTEYTKNEIIKTFEICEGLAQKQGFRVGMVVHLSNSAYVNKNCLTDFFVPLFDSFPSVDLCIENSTVGSETRIKSGVLADGVPNCVSYLRDVLNNKNIYSVLDICHASATIRALNLIVGNDMHYQEKEKLENYYVKFSDTCKIIHFNYLRNLGRFQDHGTGMTDKEFEMCYGLYLKYIPNSNLVIEMREKDYADCVNLKNTIKQIENYNKEHPFAGA